MAALARFIKRMRVRRYLLNPKATVTSFYDNHIQGMHSAIIDIKSVYEIADGEKFIKVVE